jgi:hypothetical protein
MSHELLPISYELFLSQLFDHREHPMDEIEIQIEGDDVIFSWNNPEIQEMAEALGEPEFETPRPCG